MRTAFEVRRSIHCDADLEAILDHLIEAYRTLGDPIGDAFDRAADRLQGIEADIEHLGDMPFQGALVPQIMAGLRHVTKDRAVYYFVVDEAARELRILGVFFGGRDHRRHILNRITAMGSQAVVADGNHSAD